MQPAGTSNLGKVRAYYDQTWLDYRLLWLNRRNLAIHFGYWDEKTRSHSQALTNLNVVLASALQIGEGEAVLDAGCGVGGSAVWLAEHYSVTVIGITPVPSQVERARQFAHQRGVAGRASFELQDYTRTAFPSGSFDVIWAMESLCHAHDKAAFFREAARLLRPGGRLGVIEYLRRSRPLPPGGEGLLQSWLSGWAIPDLLTPGEIREACAAAGFSEIKLRDITENVRPSLRRLHRIASVSWPLELLGHRLGLRTLAQHGNARGARDQYRALERGLWLDALMVARRS
jgi:cyclopropane fatty-acyl-phospholipid synthase-like methyltransferase